MSYIRALSNPERLYVYDGSDGVHLYWNLGSPLTNGDEMIVLAVAKNPNSLGKVEVQSLGEATTFVNVLKERRYAPHVGPEGCPHYYDGCHCAEAEFGVREL